MNGRCRRMALTLETLLSSYDGATARPRARDEADSYARDENCLVTHLVPFSSARRRWPAAIPVPDASYVPAGQRRKAPTVPGYLSFVARSYPVRARLSMT